MEISVINSNVREPLTNLHRTFLRFRVIFDLCDYAGPWLRRFLIRSSRYTSVATHSVLDKRSIASPCLAQRSFLLHRFLKSYCNN